MSQTTATIGKNISFIVISRAITIGVTFFLFPFVVKHVGKEVYGVFLIVSTVTGYFGLLDLGVMTALKKYVSEFKGGNNLKMMGEVISASFSFYVLAGIFVALVSFFCYGYFAGLFKIAQTNISIIRQLFLIAGISALFIWPLSTFRGAIQGLSLWYADSVISVGVQLLYAFATIFLLKSGSGIVQVFMVSQVLTVFGSIASYLILKNSIEFKILFPYNKVKIFKFIFNFSIFMFAASVLSMFMFQVHNIIIGYFLSMSAVTLYAVAYNIQNVFRVINSSLGSAPWLVASEMEGNEDYWGQKKLLLKGTKHMSAVFIPIVLIVFIFARPFINYWMGPGFQESILPARIIIIFWLFNGTIELASGMLTAKGIVRRPLLIQLITAALSIVISILFIRRLGIVAIALGLTVSMICVGFPFYLYLSLKVLKVTLKEYFNKTIKMNLLLYLFVAIFALVARLYFYPMNLIFTLFEMGLIYAVILLLYYLIFLDNSEKLDIKRLLGYKKIA